MGLDHARHVKHQEPEPNCWECLEAEVEDLRDLADQQNTLNERLNDQVEQTMAEVRRLRELNAELLRLLNLNAKKAQRLRDGILEHRDKLGDPSHVYDERLWGLLDE